MALTTTRRLAKKDHDVWPTIITAPMNMRLIRPLGIRLDCIVMCRVGRGLCLGKGTDATLVDHYTHSSPPACSPDGLLCVTVTASGAIAC